MKKTLTLVLLFFLLLPSISVSAVELDEPQENTRPEQSGIFNDVVEDYDGLFDTTSPWLKDADMSIYNDPIDAREAELEITPKKPGAVEKKVAELIRNLSSSLIEMLEQYIGASLDRIVYGRVGSGKANSVNIFSFELRKGNPYGVTGAIIYSMLRSIAVLFVGVSYVFNLAKATWSGQTGKSREEIKSGLYNTLYIFVLLGLTPYLLDMALYIRDVILYGIKVVMGEMVGNGAVFSLTESFLLQAENSKRLLDALMYLGTVLLTLMFIFLYVGIAIDMLVGFMIFPGVCVTHSKNKDLLSNWINIMKSDAATPIIDAVLLLVPLLTSIMLADTVRGLWIIQLVMCTLIVPAREKAKRYLGLQSSDKGGLVGAFAMMALGKQLFGMGKKGASRIADIHSDREKAKTHDELANVDKEAEESMLSNPNGEDSGSSSDSHNTDINDDDQFGASSGEENSVEDSNNEGLDTDDMDEDYGDEGDNSDNFEEDSLHENNVDEENSEEGDAYDDSDTSMSDEESNDELSTDEGSSETDSDRVEEEDEQTDERSTLDENQDAVSDTDEEVDIDAADNVENTESIETEEGAETDEAVDTSHETNNSENEENAGTADDSEAAEHKSEDSTPANESGEGDSGTEEKTEGAVNASNVNEARRAIQDGLRKRQSKIDQLRSQKAAQVARQRKYEREMLNHKKGSNEYNEAAKNRADAALSASNIDRKIADESKKMNDLRAQADALKSVSTMHSSGPAPTSFDEKRASILAKRANIDNFEQPEYFNSLSNAQKAELYRKRAKSTGFKLAAETGGSLLGGTVAAGLFAFASPQTMATGVGGGIAAGGAAAGAATTAGRVLTRSTENQVSDLMLNGRSPGNSSGIGNIPSGTGSGGENIKNGDQSRTATGQKIVNVEQPTNPGEKTPVIDTGKIENEVMRDVERAISNSVSSDVRFMDSECLNVIRQAADEAEAYGIRQSEGAGAVSEEEIRKKRVSLQTDALSEVILNRMGRDQKYVKESSEYKLAKDMVEESVREILEHINRSFY